MSAGRSVRDAPPSSAVSSAILSRYQTLRRLLIKISYTSPFPPDLLLSAAPPALTLPILSHLFLSYSPHLTQHFLSSGFLLSSSHFSLAALWGLLGAVFGYRPALSQVQFGAERGYVERKLQLLCDVLQMCVAKAEELDREKGGGSGGSGGGVPRVAVIVNQKRRSGGTEQQPQQEERKEQRHERRPSASASTAQRHQHRREERKVEVHDADEEEEDDNDSPPQQRQHQHISFTHDDSSQPLSPSHLTPSSNSHRSRRHLSPPSRQYSQSQSSTGNTAAMDPLLALHQQLHRISHRTNQLAHDQPHGHSDSQQDDSSQSAAVQRLAERVQAIEVTVRDELAELRREVQEMRQQLAAAAQRDQQREQLEATHPAKQGEMAEEKEAVGAGFERVTSGGGGSGAVSNGTSASAGVLAIQPQPKELSEFLTHMNDRISSTAKLLESSRRARGNATEGE